MTKQEIKCEKCVLNSIYLFSEHTLVEEYYLFI